MTNTRDWEKGGPKLDCRGVEMTHHYNRKGKLAIAVVTLLALMLPNHEALARGDGGFGGGQRGASAQVAPTVVLSEAVSVSAEVITASEDLAAEDSVTLQLAVNLTTEARSAIPTGLRATTTPTPTTAAAIRSAAFSHQIG
jgi:hypothetical protein